MIFDQQCHPQRHSASKAETKELHPFNQTLTCHLCSEMCLWGYFSPCSHCVCVDLSRWAQTAFWGFSGVNMFDCCSHAFVRVKQVQRGRVRREAGSLQSCLWCVSRWKSPRDIMTAESTFIGTQQFKQISAVAHNTLGKAVIVSGWVWLHKQSLKWTEFNIDQELSKLVEWEL